MLKNLQTKFCATTKNLGKEDVQKNPWEFTNPSTLLLYMIRFGIWISQVLKVVLNILYFKLFGNAFFLITLKGESCKKDEFLENLQMGF